MEDNEWLNSLKVGDKVCVRHGYDSKNMSIRTVKKITPKKNIRLNNDLLFKNDECRQSVWSSIAMRNPLKQGLKPVCSSQLGSIDAAELIEAAGRAANKGKSISHMIKLIDVE